MSTEALGDFSALGFGLEEEQSRHLLEHRRADNYLAWYDDVIGAANLAEHSTVRGCMIITPNGYALWENIQRLFDERLKREGIENVYFPMFIPLRYFQKEASHVEGFAKECAVVTHYRLKKDQTGKIAPDPEAALDEPLVVRPTSETIISEYFSRRVQYERDLPVRINQWANVVRWEHQTRLFLRTTEFLWQEGHTVHATPEEAQTQALRMLQVYKEFVEGSLAVPVIVGEKSPGERFAGAEKTYCLEAMMQDGKALQECTSHYLGQKFSQAFNISFRDRRNGIQYPYTTSWGLTTRVIGSVIMVHSDDDGLRQPPKIASKHIVIIPCYHKASKEAVDGYAQRICDVFRQVVYDGQLVRCFIDGRALPPAKKFWDAVVKGIPIRVEVGPREVDAETVLLSRRDHPHREKTSVPLDGHITDFVKETLQEIQNEYFQQALRFRDERIKRDIADYDSLVKFFSSEENSKMFVLAKWCEDPSTEEMLKPINVTIRCIPLEQTQTEGCCILTGKPCKTDVILAKSY